MSRYSVLRSMLLMMCMSGSSQTHTEPGDPNAKRSQTEGRIIPGRVLSFPPLKVNPAAPIGRPLASYFNFYFWGSGKIPKSWKFADAYAKVWQLPNDHDRFRYRAQGYYAEFIRADGSVFTIPVERTYTSDGLEGGGFSADGFADGLAGAVGLRVYNREKKLLMEHHIPTAQDPDLDLMSLVQTHTTGEAPKFQITWKVTLRWPWNAPVGDVWTKGPKKRPPGFSHGELYVSWDDGKTWVPMVDPKSPDISFGSYTFDFSLFELYSKRYIRPRFALVATINLQVYVKYYLPGAQGNSAYRVESFK